MKLSIVIICWNDLKVIAECLRSIYVETRDIEFEVIISDNGSSDGSLAFVRQEYPQVRVVENRANLGFARGNNAGIAAATGEYILILNPDTIILDRALQKWIGWADAHPEAGAFGCRVLNRDGSYQGPARPFPTIWRYICKALYLKPLMYASRASAIKYLGWDGRTEREIDWQSGCCVMFRGELLKKLDGFDERFFYHFEEVDLCLRVKQAGFSVRYYSDAEIIHLGGQSVGRFPIRFELEKYRNRYRYFHKHFGMQKLRACRWVSVLDLWIRRVGYSAVRIVRRDSEAVKNRLAMYRVALEWNWRLDPQRFIESGEEPSVGYEPIVPAPRVTLQSV
jgi:GT2 family glycosyltransferase